jgi:hypothetical protein
MTLRGWRNRLSELGSRLTRADRAEGKKAVEVLVPTEDKEPVGFLTPHEVEEPVEWAVPYPAIRSAAAVSQCEALTHARVRCSRRALPGSRFCKQHLSLEAWVQVDIEGRLLVPDGQCHGVTASGARCKRRLRPNEVFCIDHLPAQGRCYAKTSRGTRCRRKASEGELFCDKHKESRQKQLEEARKARSAAISSVWSSAGAKRPTGLRACTGFRGRPPPTPPPRPSPSSQTAPGPA